jgi:2,3-dihydro-2,3-dihydroxybenzoate dehydrogenase
MVVLDATSAGGLLSALACIVFASYYCCCCYSRRPRSATGDGRRVVVVSGAASGLGRATCLALAEKGDRVIALDVNAEGLATLAKEARAGHQILTLTCDVASAWTDVAQKIQQDLPLLFSTFFGGNALLQVDAVINLAGLIRGGPLMEIPATDVSLVMRVNVEGTHNLNRAIFQRLRRTGDGADPKIFIIASEVSYARLSTAMNAPYSMSKFALEAYAVGLRQELSVLQDGPVKVIVVNPGAHATPLLLDQLSGGSNAFFEQHAAREGGTLWAGALARGGRVAQQYMRRFAKSPEGFAERIVGLVHAPSGLCADRVLINVSPLMRVAAWTPQWVLDWSFRLQMTR